MKPVSTFHRAGRPGRGEEQVTKHAFCDVCDAVRPLEHLDTTGRYRGRDMVCTVCGFSPRDQ